ncbi:MAG: hypothetical protein WBI63_10060 [Coriobacteriia bacterium]
MEGRYNSGDLKNTSPMAFTIKATGLRTFRSRSRADIFPGKILRITK